MASTNKTPNYQLSQFLGTDKPSWETDYNGDMLKIDTGIHAASIAATGAESSATTALEAANAAQTAATAADTKATQAASDATAAKTTADTAQTTATNAQTAANTAQTTATNAQNTASTANTTAVAASVAANEAKELATAANTGVTALGPKTISDKQPVPVSGKCTTSGFMNGILVGGCFILSPHFSLTTTAAITANEDLATWALPAGITITNGFTFEVAGIRNTTSGWAPGSLKFLFNNTDNTVHIKAAGSMEINKEYRPFTTVITHKIGQ